MEEEKIRKIAQISTMHLTQELLTNVQYSDDSIVLQNEKIARALKNTEKDSMDRKKKILIDTIGSVFENVKVA
uniref:Uncharacterized protein n=1 Tax=Onchocerca volvulus TaxID=6282 RepID=A0A8R1TNM5_ONCVO